MIAQAAAPNACGAPREKTASNGGARNTNPIAAIGDDQAQRGEAQLGEGGTRHHPAEVREGRIGAQAQRLLRQAEPDPAAPLHQGGKGAIVDQRAAQGRQAARLRQRLPRDQHAAARGRGRAPARIIDPGKRVEHLEKENKGGNEPAFRRALAAQLHHQRGEGRALGLGDRDQTAKEPAPRTMSASTNSR